MKISNPKTGEFVENKSCNDCYCHSLPVQFGELVSGCCSECGCPKNLEGFEYFKKRLREEASGQKVEKEQGEKAAQR